jgi:hypothetical protein
VRARISHKVAVPGTVVYCTVLPGSTTVLQYSTVLYPARPGPGTVLHSPLPPLSLKDLQKFYIYTSFREVLG